MQTRVRFRKWMAGEVHRGGQRFGRRRVGLKNDRFSAQLGPNYETRTSVDGAAHLSLTAAWTLVTVSQVCR
jgi:hypothetical protein